MSRVEIWNWEGVGIHFTGDWTERTMPDGPQVGPWRFVVEGPTSEDELDLFVSLAAPDRIVAGAGSSRTESGSISVDSRWRKDARLDVDTVTALPILLPPSAARPQGQLGGSQLFEASREWVRAGFRLWSARSRSAEPSASESTLPPTSGRLRTRWPDANRHLLPLAERQHVEPSFPRRSRNVVVVGAQRSGTTWLADCLATSPPAERYSEEVTLDVLLDGFAPPAGRPEAIIWQGTFLTACPALLASLAGHASATIAMVRDPVAIARSMLHHWTALPFVADMASAIRHVDAPRAPIEQAIFVIRCAWSTLLAVADSDGTHTRPDVMFVDYDQLCQSPRQLEAIAERAGLADVDAASPTSAARSFPELSSVEARQVTRALDRPYRELVRRCM